MKIQIRTGISQLLQMSIASDMKYLLLLAALCGFTLGQNRVDPLVSTKLGLIRGLRDANGYSKFLGVPYGKVGKNIFGAAEPHPGFHDIFEAYDDSKICVQMDRRSSGISGTTDCLHLNIYVPESANSRRRLPVMVWIHGGAFIGGSNMEESTNPLALLKHDVIVVTLNYRVGIFGFMCLDIPEVPGNTGLKDQVLALRWINENIVAFGGDANQITLFGVSAGGMSTNLHLFSLNEKLFNRAIIQSGPATSYWMMVESNNTIPTSLAAKLGFQTTNINEALSFLMDADPHTIAQVAHDLMITNAAGSNQPLTKPCVEQKFEGIEQFITEHPMNIRSNKASTTPVIIGHSNYEFAFQYVNADAAFFDTYDFRQLFSLGFDMRNDLTEAIDVVKHFYIGDEDISEKVRWEIINFGSDLVFNHATQRMAQKLLNSGARSIYRYVFTYSGSMNKTWSGASHGDDASYLFDMNRGGGEKSPEDQLMVNRLTTLWTNFAKYGDPTPTTSELLPINWIPMTKSKYHYLEIDSVLTPKSRPFHDRMAFWDLFYKQYGHYQKWYKPEGRRGRYPLRQVPRGPHRTI